MMLTHHLAACYRPNRFNIGTMIGHGSTILQYSYRFRLYPSSAQRQQLNLVMRDGYGTSTCTGAPIPTGKRAGKSLHDRAELAPI